MVMKRALWLAVAFIIFSIGVLGLAAQFHQAPQSNASTPTMIPTVQQGTKQTSNDVFMADQTKTLDEMLPNDRTGVSNLLAARKIVVLLKGTKVSILDFKGQTYTVRVIDGDYQGQSGYVRYYAFQ